MFRYFASFAVVAFVSNVVYSGKIPEGSKPLEPKEKVIPKWPVGSYRNCVVNNLPYRLEALAGLGWDNLRNEVTGEVSFYNYSMCRTTEDGNYLIPDDVFVTPIKDSEVNLRSELIDNYLNYKSTTAMTINLQAHASLSFGSISGTFSYEHQNIKKHQVEDKSITSRVQLRTRVYAVHLQPDSQLHPKFKNRLLDIASHMQRNNMPMARYLTDMLIRDYGTHYITRVEVGGALTKVDHISRHLDMSGQEAKDEVKASASLSFQQVFGLTISGSYSSDLEISKTYKDNVKDSYIHSYGGPPVRENFTVAYWEDNLINNLVPIDREGKPLNFLITPQSFPELPEELTFNLSASVLKSIELYYKNNAIRGCTKAGSPNFNFAANLEDGTCDPPTDFTFGGVFQTCHQWGLVWNPCDKYAQKNPKTQGYSCPSGYKSVLLHEGPIQAWNTKYDTEWFLTKIIFRYWKGRYKMYWCVAEKSASKETGFLFGGLYSKTTNNQVTKAKECPNKFFPQHFGPKDMYVCISDDFELGGKSSLPFGGFLSCSAGNPLAMKSLEDGFKDPSTAPKHCPQGHSRHLAVIDADCEINYCIKTGWFSSNDLPFVRQPPFYSKPVINMAITIPLIIENNDTAKVYIREQDGNWVELTSSLAQNLSLKAQSIDPSLGAIENLKNVAMGSLHSSSSSSQSSSGGGLDGGTATGIAVGVVLLAGIVVIAFFVRRRGTHTPLDGSRMENHPFNS